MLSLSRFSTLPTLSSQNLLTAGTKRNISTRVQRHTTQKYWPASSPPMSAPCSLPQSLEFILPRFAPPPSCQSKPQHQNRKITRAKEHQNLRKRAKQKPSIFREYRSKVATKTQHRRKREEGERERERSSRGCLLRAIRSLVALTTTSVPATLHSPISFTSRPKNISLHPAPALTHPCRAFCTTSPGYAGTKHQRTRRSAHSVFRSCEVALFLASLRRVHSFLSSPTFFHPPTTHTSLSYAIVNGKT